MYIIKTIIIEISIESDEEDNSANSNIIDKSSSSEVEQKRNKGCKYKPRNPLYFYYTINGNQYKYTCRNKYRKNILGFSRSDIACPTQAQYFKNIEKFKLNVLTSHKDYCDVHM